LEKQNLTIYNNLYKYYGKIYIYNLNIIIKYLKLYFLINLIFLENWILYLYNYIYNNFLDLDPI
jgi:hypothetical protein